MHLKIFNGRSSQSFFFRNYLFCCCFLRRVSNNSTKLFVICFFLSAAILVFFLWIFFLVLIPSSCTFYDNIDFLYNSVEKLACTFFPRAAIGQLWVKQHQKYNCKSSKQGFTQDAKRRARDSAGILKAIGLKPAQKAY